MGDRSPKEKMKKKKQHDEQVQKQQQQKAAKILQMRPADTGTKPTTEHKDPNDYKKAS